MQMGKIDSLATWGGLHMNYTSKRSPSSCVMLMRKWTGLGIPSRNWILKFSQVVITISYLPFDEVFGKPSYQ